jgi:transposase
MKTARNRGILVMPHGHLKPTPVWCFEPVCESGRTLFLVQRSVAFRRKAEEHEKEYLITFLRPRRAAKRSVMQILYSRCCGIDVHKDSVTVCVLVYSDRPEPEVRKKEFATYFKALLNLKIWLLAQKVTHVAMESTGVYWKPVWQALEGSFELILANPYQVKNIPGKKTDARDSQWLAELLAHGLIKPSFVPPRETREQRDLTRYRVKLTEERNRIHNRIHKVLEDACIKLDTVASDILGATGRAIMQAIIDGVESPNFLAEKAKGRLLAKIPDLRLALRGRITDHHRLMLRELLEDLEFVERKIFRLEQNIASGMDLQIVARLCTIPGIDMITAWTILAELGSDMSVFGDPKHTASWAGGLGGHAQEELLCGCVLLPQGGQARYPQGHCGDCPPFAGYCLLHSPGRNGISGIGERLFRPVASRANPQPACAQITKARPGSLPSTAASLRRSPALPTVHSATPPRAALLMRPTPNPLYSQPPGQLSFRRIEKILPIAHLDSRITNIYSRLDGITETYQTGTANHGGSLEPRRVIDSGNSGSVS